MNPPTPAAETLPCSDTPKTDFVKQQVLMRVDLAEGISVVENYRTALDELASYCGQLERELATLRQPQQEIPESSLRRPTVTETHAAATWIPLSVRKPTKEDALPTGNVIGFWPDNTVGTFPWENAGITRAIFWSAPPAPTPTPEEQAEAEDDAAWTEYCSRQSYRDNIERDEAHDAWRYGAAAGRRSRGGAK